VNFLAPLFLLGGLAVTLPIIFHLIRRTSREKMPFSSLMFLQPLPPRVTKRSRLENIWLLILRCIVLCLLAFAFARPYLQKPAAASAENSETRTVVVLLDDSASMRREGVWPAAVAKAAEILKGVSAGDQAALYLFDRQLHAAISLEQWTRTPLSERPTLVSQRLAEIKPGWASTHFGAALTGAAEVLEELKTSQNSGRRQIVLISDLQEGAHLDGLQGYEWPRGIEVTVEPIKSRRVTNAGLQWVQDRDEKSNDDTLRVRVSNSSDSKREQFKIQWLSANPPGQSESLDVYVPPGQSRIVIAPHIPTNAVEARLVLTGDDEDFDNNLYFVAPAVTPMNILFFGDDTEKDSTQLLYYLKHAFQDTRRQRVQILPRTGAASNSGADTNAAQIAIVSDNPASRLPEIETFLKEGKTVLAVMKSAGAASLLGKLLNISALAAEEAKGSEYTMFGQIDFQHPLFAPLADPRFSDFTKIHFWHHRRLGEIPGARVIVRFDDNDPALLQVAVGKGTLFILTAAWTPTDSQLALSSKFIPLLYSLLEFSGAVKSQSGQYAVGDEVILESKNAAATLRRPDGSTAELAAGATKFSQADQPGLYSVGSGPGAQRFAVNLAAEESRTAPLPVEELLRLGVPLKSTTISETKLERLRRENLAAAELENRQKLWKGLLVAALVVLILET
jgi:hypothetical protein